MGRRKKGSLPFDQRGGIIVLSKRLLVSVAFSLLTPEAKILMILLQVHWRDHVPVAYSVREGMSKVGCSKGTVQRAFIQLQELGFIEMIDESLFNSRTQSKARTWRLTWMPYRSMYPTNEWEKIKTTVSKTHPLDRPRDQKCTFMISEILTQDTNLTL